MTLRELLLLQEEWRRKLRREYYVIGRPCSVIMAMLDSLRRTVVALVSGKNQEALSWEAYDIFPEIKVLDKALSGDSFDDEVVEIEEEDLDPGAKGLLLSVKSSMLGDRLAKLEAHKKRVAELKS